MTEAENQIRGAHEVAVLRLKQIRETIAAMRGQERLAYLRIKDCEAAGRVFGIAFEPIDQAPKQPSDLGSVREFTLSRLMNSPDGIKAPSIAAAYKEAFGRDLHPKTIGMTLYRLKREGACERKGHVWRPLHRVGDFVADYSTLTPQEIAQDDPALVELYEHSAVVGEVPK